MPSAPAHPDAPMFSPTVPDAVAADPAVATGQGWRRVALAGLTAALIAVSLWLAYPYLPAITWGAALAIVAWPMHARLRRWTHRPGLAAALSWIIVLLIILLPVLLVGVQIGREATAAANRLQGESPESVLREQGAALPIVRDVIAWMDRVDLDLEGAVRRTIESYTRGATDIARGSLGAIVQFLVALFILYHLFRDRGAFLQGTRSLLPLSRDEGDRVMMRVADSVHAHLYANLITSAIDSISFGVLFWVFGVPSPLLWGVVMFVLCFLPVVGAGMVWAPAAGYLALSGSWLGCATLLLWGAFTAVLVDNILLARLAGDRMRMHPVLALIGFLGGLAVFGVSGIILGPAILAVTEAVIDVWRQRAAAAEAQALARNGSA